MNILTCTDSRFVIPTGVMLYSVCKNNEGEELNFHIVVDNSVSLAQKDSLYEEIIKFEKTKVSFYKIDVEDIEKYLIVVLDRFPKSIYYRLLVTDILPSNIDKVLYLDGDIIVRHKIVDLWNTDIKKYAVAAVVNQSNGYNYWERLNYPKEKGYFNSGVMLINLKYWRDNGLKYKFLDYIKKNPDKLLFPDQDVLNSVLYDSKILLPEQYNMQEFFYLTNRESVECENTDHISKYVSNPSILHFTGRKPWNRICRHPLKNEYESYKRQTSWKWDTSLEDNSMSKGEYIKWLVKSTIRGWLGLSKEKKYLKLK